MSRFDSFTHQRALLDEERDTAAIVFPGTSLGLPETPLPLAPQEKFLAVGGDVGWLGFPAIGVEDVCFFGGRVSAWSSPRYLVDGVAIHGVSGGPAFTSDGAEVVLMGVVSA